MIKKITPTQNWRQAQIIFNFLDFLKVEKEIKSLDLKDTELNNLYNEYLEYEYKRCNS